MKTEKIDSRTAARWLTPRRKDANKGDVGRVLVIAGSRDMPGASVLCALGAVRGGAGLVRVATVKSRQETLARRAPLEVTTAALPEDKAGRLSSAAWVAVRRLIDEFHPTVIAVGPGLGRSVALNGFLRRLFTLSAVPLVLDADALNALSVMKRAPLFRAPVIMTPHPGEMSRLQGARVGADGAARVEAAASLARRFGGVVLLKGAGTVVSDGKIAWRNTTGNPAMASGGMGDVLTGLIAATWAQMPERTVETGVRAAAFGAFVHGLSGDIARQKFPERTLLASDLAAALPRAFHRLWRRSAQ